MNNQQLVFSGENVSLKPQRQKTEIFTFQQQGLCPYCMHVYETDKFLISTKKGYHRGMGKCPNCQNNVQWKTLFQKWNPESFADWVFVYSRDGFWRKVKYQQFNDGLRVIDWIDPFWLRYKALKGDSTEQTESYQDYIERSQVEDAKEKGLID